MSRDAKAASRFRGLLTSERNSADLYSGLADAATGERREVLTELAGVERRHAARWAAKLIELGVPVPPASATVSLPCVVMLSPRVFARRGGDRLFDIACRCGSLGLMILWAKLRLCPGSDFVDRVVFERREILDDER